MANRYAVPRQSRRGLMGRSAASLLAPLAAACSGPAPSAQPDAQAGPITVTVWYNAFPPATAIPAYEQTAREFQEQHPNTRVSMEPLAGNTSDQEEKILAAVAGGAGPDLTYVHPIYNATLAVKAVTAPLEPFLAKSRGAFDLQDFYPGAIDYFRWDGKLWGLPNYSGPGVFYYNTDLLQRLGLADPWALFQRGQWTSQLMDDYVTRLTSGQGETKVFGRHDLSRSIRVQSPWIQGFGGEVWNAKVTETRLHEDGAVKAWEYLSGQLIKGYAPRPEDLRGVSGGTRGLFNSGRIAFYFGIRSEVPDLKVPFGTVPVHKMPNGKEYNRDGPNALSILGGSRQQDAAWRVLTFAVTRGVEVNLSAGLTAPTTRRHAKSAAWLTQLIGGEVPHAYEAAANQVKALVHPPRLTQIDRLIQDAYQQVVGGEASAKAAMAAIKPQVDAILTAPDA